MNAVIIVTANTYRLVEIGDQCWFADNSKEIPTTNKGWYGYYENAESEPSPGEGLLYTWDAAMNGETHEQAQGVCPAGWHVPSACDLMVLKTTDSDLLNTPFAQKITKTYFHPKLEKQLTIPKDGFVEVISSTIWDEKLNQVVMYSLGTKSNIEYISPGGRRELAVSMRYIKN